MTSGEYRRNQLLGCLPLGLIATEEARRIVDEAVNGTGLPPNGPDFRTHFGVFRPRTGAELYEIPAASPTYQIVSGLKHDADSFTRSHCQSNEAPDPEAIAGILPTLRNLRAAISENSHDPANAKYLNAAWLSLLEACAEAAKANDLSCLSQDGVFLKGVFLEEVERTSGAGRNNEAESRGSRPTTARGLLFLCRCADCLDRKVTVAIRELSRDPESVVRSETLSFLWCLYRTDQALLWDLVEERSRNEDDARVLRALMANVGRNFSSEHPARATEVAATVLARPIEGDDANEVRSICSNIWTGLFVYRSYQPAHEYLQRLFERPESESGDVIHVIGAVRNCMGVPVEERKRAVHLWREILDVANIGWRQLGFRVGNKPQSDWSPQEIRDLGSLAGIFDSLAHNIFFSGGIGEVPNSGIEPGETDRLASYFSEVRSLLADMAGIGTPQSVYYLLKLFEAFLPFDPEVILLWLGQCIVAGRRFGFQYDPLAGGLFARIVQRILAEHPSAVRSTPACARALGDVLDTFVDAGLPEAHRLAYQLGDLYR